MNQKSQLQPLRKKNVGLDAGKGAKLSRLTATAPEPTATPHPVLARVLCGRRGLPDRRIRNHVGRWAAASVEPARRGEYLTNRYGSDAARGRSVAVRRTVAKAARDIVGGAAGWQSLEVDGGGFERFMESEPSVAEPEPIAT